MSLDKQRILSELGSVMNQLQTADCGCMGKLFSNQGQGGGSGGGGGQAMMGNPLPTCGGCRRGCCPGHGGGVARGPGGHGFGTPCAGEPYSMQSHCMGHCNPPKLYADTYNYLNQNLMQPAVKEVYDDLKSITPANTMANNPMAAQMGLASSGNPHVGGQNSMGGGGMGTQNPMQGMGNANGMQGMGNANGMQGMGNAKGMQGMGNANGIQDMGNPNTMQNMGNMNPMQNMSNQNPIQNMGNPNTIQNMGNTGNTMGVMPNTNQQAMGHMNITGMGPQIMGMLKSEGGSKPPMQGQGRPLSGPMVVDAPQSPHGQVGITPITQAGGGNQGQYDPYMGQPNRGQMQGIGMQQNVYTASTPGDPMSGNVAQGMTGAQPMNPAAQQMSTGAHRSYGQHTPGMAKFNEMFPGVMQGLGGDLGFDPMAIAIQMNPANQQKAAMQTMQKVMDGNKGFDKQLDPTSNAARLQPAIAGSNAAVASLGQPMQGQLNQQITPQQNFAPGPGQLLQQPGQVLQQSGQVTQEPNQVIQQPDQMMQQPSQALQQSGYGNAEVPPTGQLGTGRQMPPQQVYTTLTGAPQMQHQGQYQKQSPQQMIDPNTGAVINNPNFPEIQEGSVDPNAPIQQQPPQTYTTAPSDAPPQAMIKEPIFPVDNSRNQPAPMMKQQKYYQYNTLGQPIEMLPAHVYHSPDPGLPQTLSPQGTPSRTRADQRYSNVKATVSKTSIMGGAGRTQSRSQLQHIYNQYKGSQSYTQQNMKQPNQGGSYSDGKLNVPLRNEEQIRPVPVEKMGGDTAANNQTLYNQETPNKVENVVGQRGDVPAVNKPLEVAMPVKKYRNGLQDMVYTSYPTSAAWSFHGNRELLPSGYRFK